MKNLKRYRQRKILTQEQLAERAGVHPRSVASWESGANVGPTSVQKVAAVLGIEPEDLVYNELPEGDNINEL